MSIFELAIQEGRVVFVQDLKSLFRICDNIHFQTRNNSFFLNKEYNNIIEILDCRDMKESLVLFRWLTEDTV